MTHHYANQESASDLQEDKHSKIPIVEHDDVGASRIPPPHIYIEVDITTFEEAVLRAGGAKHVDDITFTWEKCDGDESTSYSEISIEKITIQTRPGIHQVVFFEPDGFNQHSRAFIEKIDLELGHPVQESNTNRKRTLWFLSATQPEGLEQGTVGPKAGRYLLIYS